MSDSKRSLAYLKKAEDDLQQARILFDADHADGSINRAYYALFDGILALLHTTKGPIPKTHTGAHTEFRKQFIQTDIFGKEHSNTITELFNLRQGGDYELDFAISLEDAQSAVNQASQFSQEVHAHLYRLGLA